MLKIGSKVKINWPAWQEECEGIIEEYDSKLDSYTVWIEDCGDEYAVIPAKYITHIILPVNTICESYS